MPPNVFAGTTRPAPTGQASPPDDPSQLYFAYGSNLHLTQMAQRCPGSTFVGYAKLDGYRWQINERGYANVVPTGGDGDNKSSSLVEGLVFRVTRQDEVVLDAYEGVLGEFYQKQRLPVQLTPHPRYADQPTAAVSHAIAQMPSSGGGGPSPGVPAASKTNTSTGGTDPDKPMPVKYTMTALVYVSEHYIRDGLICYEYIGRMQNAVKDAVALGVSQAFVNEVITPHLGLSTNQ